MMIPPMAKAAYAEIRFRLLQEHVGVFAKRALP
jgi:hypothetical protein